MINFSKGLSQNIMDNNGQQQTHKQTNQTAKPHNQTTKMWTNMKMQQKMGVGWKGGCLECD